MAIGSTLYPNANVSTAGTVSTNNGNRTPVTKVNDGDAVVFIVKNAEGTDYGGNWLATVSIALTSGAALISAPGTRSESRSYTVNGTTYYFSYQSTNNNWGTGAVGSGATEIYNPLGLPVFNDWFMHSVNANFTQAKVEEIIQTLGIVPDYTPSSSGGSVYIGNNSSLPYKVINIFVNRLNKSKIAKGWVGVANEPRLFWGGKKGLIPKMTNNTSPRGLCVSGDNGGSSDTAFYAFDDNPSTYFGAAIENVYGWVSYEFDSLVSIDYVEINACKLAMSNHATYNFTLKVSLYYNGSWHDYGTFELTTYNGTNFVWETFKIFGGTVNNVQKIKVETLTEKIYGTSYHIQSIQAYGKD